MCTHQAVSGLGTDLYRYAGVEEISVRFSGDVVHVSDAGIGVADSVPLSGEAGHDLPR